MTSTMSYFLYVFKKNDQKNGTFSRSFFEDENVSTVVTLNKMNIFDMKSYN